jgi:hypothetical protein
MVSNGKEVPKTGSTSASDMLKGMERTDAKKIEYSERLISLYPEHNGRMLQWGDAGERLERVPVVVFAAPREQWHEYDSVLAGLNTDPKAVILPEALQAERDRYVEKMVSAGRNMTNQVTYTMQKLVLSEGGRIQLQCGVGTYFDAMGSCASLLGEFYEKGQMASSLEELPLRSAVHINGVDPMFNGSTRSAAIGISVLLVYRDSEGQYNYIVRRRGEKVARYPGVFHVIPGFTFQPKEKPENPKEEFSIRYQVECEYLEELFSLEGKGPRGHGLQGPSMLPEGRYLEELLSDKSRAQLVFTGVTMALSELWPEITMLLLIHDPGWSERVKGKDGHRPISMKAIQRLREDTAAPVVNALVFVTPPSRPWLPRASPLSAA